MHRIEFRSDYPIQHLQRALDELARMGLNVSDLSARIDASQGRVRIRLRGADLAQAESLRARLGRLPGVDCLPPTSGLRITR